MSEQLWQIVNIAYIWLRALCMATLRLLHGLASDKHVWRLLHTFNPRVLNPDAINLVWRRAATPCFAGWAQHWRWRLLHAVFLQSLLCLAR